MNNKPLPCQLRLASLRCQKQQCHLYGKAWQENVGPPKEPGRTKPEALSYLGDTRMFDTKKCSRPRCSNVANTRAEAEGLDERKSAIDQRSAVMELLHSFKAPSNYRELSDCNTIPLPPT